MRRHAHSCGRSVFDQQKSIFDTGRKWTVSRSGNLGNVALMALRKHKRRVGETVTWLLVTDQGCQGKESLRLGGARVVQNGKEGM